MPEEKSMYIFKIWSSIFQELFYPREFRFYSCFRDIAIQQFTLRRKKSPKHKEFNFFKLKDLFF